MVDWLGEDQSAGTKAAWPQVPYPARSQCLFGFWHCTKHLNRLPHCHHGTICLSFVAGPSHLHRNLISFRRWVQPESFEPSEGCLHVGELDWAMLKEWFGLRVGRVHSWRATSVGVVVQASRNPSASTQAVKVLFTLLQTFEGRRGECRSTLKGQSGAAVQIFIDNKY